MKSRKIFAAFLLFLVAAFLMLEWRSPVLRALVAGNPVEILMLGLDEAEGTRRADTIALARFEPASAAVKILQVPRDTLIRHGNSWRKINSLYERGGPAAISAALHDFFVSVSSTTRFEAARYFVVLDYAAFSQLYSSLGDPDLALGYVRSRGEEGDLGRLASQRDFYTVSLSHLARQPWRFLLLLRRGGLLGRTLKTNISFWEWAALLWRLRSWAVASHIYYFPLPGQPDEKGNFKASSEIWGRTLSWWLGLGGRDAQKARPVRLEVLNASGEPGLASRWTRLLRSLPQDFSYDVLYFGNAAGELRETSTLVTRQADLYLAKQTLVSLNNKTGLRLAHQVSPGVRQGVQFTLLLGSDARDSSLLGKAGLLEDF